jgi:hypothetical protein
MTGKHTGILKKELLAANFAPFAQYLIRGKERVRPGFGAVKPNVVLG